MTSARRRNVLTFSVAIAMLTIFAGCYRDREPRHERHEERKEQKYEEHHDH